MKRLAPVVVVLAALAVACGSEEESPEEKGAGGTGGAIPLPPTFAGLEEARFDGTDTALLFWNPASDDLTPDEEIAYRVLRWESDPVDGAEPDKVYEWKQSVEQCKPTCRYGVGLPQLDVQWFAVEAVDAEGLAAGRDVVLPVVRAIDPPEVSGVSPSPASVGSVVSVEGAWFLDERVGADGFTLGGKPIDPAFVESWGNRRILFLLQDGYGSGELKVKTPLGEASIHLDVE